MAKIESHSDLVVYKKAIDVAMRIFDISKRFPKEETYSLTDQVRRSSRSVCANLAEGWRRRRYEGAFINKLNEVEGEVAESQAWLEIAVKCGYLEREIAARLYRQLDEIMRTVVGMINHPQKWLIPVRLGLSKGSRPPKAEN
jgi:four helix bundle protein